MRVRRDIASIPVRSARETWVTIINLITDSDSIDQSQLDNAASIMESLIADEMPTTIPIVVKGCGPRLLIYCVYNEDAMERGLDIDNLNHNPTSDDWNITAPCEDEDVLWMNNTLQARAPRIVVHAKDTLPPDDSNTESQVSTSFEVDWEEVT